VVVATLVHDQRTSGDCPLALHDALPILADVQMAVAVGQGAGDDGGAGHVGSFCGGGGLSHGPAERPDPAPPQEKARRSGRAWKAGWAGAYWRSHTCDLQMKATQPETSSLLPPSTSSIFDLYTLPSSGLRMVPPE